MTLWTVFETEGAMIVENSKTFTDFGPAVAYAKSLFDEDDYELSSQEPDIDVHHVLWVSIDEPDVTVNILRTVIE